MKLTPQQHAAFLNATKDFSADHTDALEKVREIANVPQYRFFTVLHDGTVAVDTTRKREVEVRKISKSNQ